MSHVQQSLSGRIFAVFNTGKLAERCDVLRDEVQATVGGVSVFDPEEALHRYLPRAW